MDRGCAPRTPPKGRRPFGNPVGRYAVRLVFDDGHDTGLYSWDVLHLLGREQEARWQAYLDALDSKGLNRG